MSTNLDESRKNHRGHRTVAQAAQAEVPAPDVKQVEEQWEARKSRIPRCADESRNRIDSGKLYRQQFLEKQPQQLENDVWRKINPRDAERIECDRHHMCAEQAVWASHCGPPFAYVCDYHRAVFDVTGTFWKGEPATPEHVT